MKQEFEMTQEEMDEIIRINESTSNTVMMVGGVDFSNNLTEAINVYWEILAAKYGFKKMTVGGSSRGKLFFIAEPAPIEVPKSETEKAVDKYDTLEKIVEQLESNNYECQGGVLVRNTAFISLKRMAGIDISEDLKPVIKAHKS